MNTPRLAWLEETRAWTAIRAVGKIKQEVFKTHRIEFDIDHYGVIDSSCKAKIEFIQFDHAGTIPICWDSANPDSVFIYATLGGCLRNSLSRYAEALLLVLEPNENLKLELEAVMLEEEMAKL